MTVGYSLGNRIDLENDVQMMLEDESNVVTFSYAVSVALSHACRNRCPYCSFRKEDTLAVPYSTIKSTKLARSKGVREASYVAGERPDKYSNVRSVLDLWGFSSYLDYMYTVCELGFLEGLIPVIEVGFLSPLEMKKMSEIVAVNRIMLDSVDSGRFDTVYPLSPGKKLAFRLKQLEWAGRLNFPTSTGIMIGIGESMSHRKQLLKHIAEIHTRYGTIHDVQLTPLYPQPGTLFAKHDVPSKKNILDTIEQAKSILPADITLVMPVYTEEDAKTYLEAGIRDFGRLFIGKDQSLKLPTLSIDRLDEIVASQELKLIQRFPLKKSFIKNGLYSKKLGQVFDAYRYKIKKDTQEKPK